MIVCILSMYTVLLVVLILQYLVTINNEVLRVLVLILIVVFMNSININSSIQEYIYLFIYEYSGVFEWRPNGNRLEAHVHNTWYITKVEIPAATLYKVYLQPATHTLLRLLLFRFFVFVVSLSFLAFDFFVSFLLLLVFIILELSRSTYYYWFTFFFLPKTFFLFR